MLIKTHRKILGTIYTEREGRTQFLFNTYQDYFEGKILDVGAGPCILKSLLPDECSYTSIGMEAEHDVRADLEKALPVPDHEYDVVFCSHVLEHVDNIHNLFGELCRVSKKHVIIALPNPYSIFASRLLKGFDENSQYLMRHHNLPTEPTFDRHKWFFNASEARQFILSNARQNGFTVEREDQMRRGLLNDFVVRLVYGLITLRSGLLQEILVGDMSWVLSREEQPG